MFVLPPSQAYEQQLRRQAKAAVPPVQVVILKRPAQLSVQPPKPKNGLRKLFAKSKKRNSEGQDKSTDGTQRSAVHNLNGRLRRTSTQSESWKEDPDKEVIIPDSPGLHRANAKLRKKSVQLAPREQYRSNQPIKPASPTSTKAHAKLVKKSIKSSLWDNEHDLDQSGCQPVNSCSPAAASVADFRPILLEFPESSPIRTNSWDEGDDDDNIFSVGLRSAVSVELLRKEIKRKPVGSVKSIPSPLEPAASVPLDTTIQPPSQPAPSILSEAIQAPPTRPAPSSPPAIDIPQPCRAPPSPPANPFRHSRASSLASGSQQSGSFKTAVSSWDNLQRRETNPFRKYSLSVPQDFEWTSWQTNENAKSFIREHLATWNLLSSPTDSGIGIWADDVPVEASSSKGKAPVVPRPRSPAYVASTEEALHFDKYLEQRREDDKLASLEQQRLDEQIACLEQQKSDEELAQALQKELEELRLAAVEQGSSPSNRDCTVCGETKGPLDFAAKPPTAACTHAVGICTECLHAWVASEFDSKGVDGFKCPECPADLSHNDVRACASVATFAAYDKICTRNALSDLAEFAWCLAPTGCASGQLNIANNDFMQCVDCGYKQCVRHRMAWHAGETCAQYDYRVSGQRARDDEAATEKMIGTVSKLCPGRNCGWRIQKTDGCDHMTCRRCKHEFCWQCLASQSEIKRVGNTAHKESCKFHSRNLDLAWPFNVHAGVNRAQEA